MQGSAVKRPSAEPRNQSKARSREGIEKAPIAEAVASGESAASSDQLVFPDDLRRLAEELGGAEVHILDTLFGHDMFLKESIRVGKIIEPFLASRG